MADRIANTVSKTDDDIADDEAGVERAKVAADSKARKASEQAELRRQGVRID